MANSELRRRTRSQATQADVRPAASPQGSTARAVLATTAPEWLWILTLIFGGCCSNAYTLELATRQLPSAGTLITFAQFLVTTLSSLPYFICFSSRVPWVRLKERKVPLYRWMVQVGLYLSTSLLNNMAFAYDVPMPVHIVFRSGGLVVNMVLGYLVQGTRYSPLQMASVVLVTLGVVSSTLYSTQTSPSPSPSASASASAPASASVSELEDADAGQYATGVLLLFSALVLTGFMGLWQEKTFRLYGNQNWRESMFYSHLLSLPIFALGPSHLVNDLHQANATTPWWFGFGPPPSPPSAAKGGWLDNLVALLSPPSLRKAIKPDRTQSRIFDFSKLFLGHAQKAEGTGVWIPSFYPPLLLNVATQLVCINGVNRLTSKVSSLSVTLVLVVRKAVSLMVSVMLVQRSMGTVGLWCGAAAVLAGTIGYSVSKPAEPIKKKE